MGTKYFLHSKFERKEKLQPETIIHVMDITATLAIIICKVTVHFLHVVMFNSALGNIIFVSLLEGLTHLLYSVNICILCPQQFVLALCPQY